MYQEISYDAVSLIKEGYEGIRVHNKIDSLRAGFTLASKIANDPNKKHSNKDTFHKGALGEFVFCALANLHGKSLKRNLNFYSGKGDDGVDFCYGLTTIDIKTKCAGKFFSKEGFELPLNDNDFRKNRMSYPYKNFDTFPAYRTYFEIADKFFFDHLYFTQIFLLFEDNLPEFKKGTFDFMQTVIHNTQQKWLDGYLTGFISAFNADTRKISTDTEKYKHKYKDAEWIVKDINDFSSLKDLFFHLDKAQFLVLDLLGTFKTIANKDIIKSKIMVVRENCLTRIRKLDGSEKDIELVLTPMDFKRDILWITKHDEKKLKFLKHSQLASVKAIQQNINGVWTEWMPIESVFFRCSN